MIELKEKIEASTQNDSQKDKTKEYKNELAAVKDEL